MKRKQVTPYLSVIIPCLNEERYVGKLLDDLCLQGKFHDFEVLVIDSGSEDETTTVAENYMNILPIDVHRLSEKGASRARNTGASFAKGRFLLFLDADIRLPTNFLYTLASEQKRTNAKTMTTYFRSSGAHPIDRLLYFLNSTYFRLTFLTSRPIMTGGIMMVERRLHESIGGFDESMNLGEDLDYSKRLGELGEKTKFVTKTKVIASNRRFRQDGRINMLAWNWEWTTNRKFSFMKRRSYRFGHYDRK